MAAETPQTWAERVVPYDDGDPITGREATIIGEDALNGFRALLLGLAQSHGLSADASHAQIMEAFKQGHALTGEIKTYAGASAPPGWLLCNGVLVRITDQLALFGVLAHTYALEADTTDSTATTFRLPDLRGRVPIGAGGGTGLTERALGAKGGDEELQAHAHYVLHNIFSGTEPYFGGRADLIDRALNEHENRVSPIGRTANAGLSSETGAGQSGNMPPWTALNYIIKT